MSGLRFEAPRHATALETIQVVVPDHAVEAYERAFGTVCRTVGLFEEDEAEQYWRVEGVKDRGAGEEQLEVGLLLARMATGVEATLQRSETAAEGWLARTYESFPEQLVGRRFALRGTHLAAERPTRRLTLTIDAGIAFGSGEHGSTRGCLRALEGIAYRRPRRILDLGTGSGVLAMAAARLLGQPVLAVDIDPWSVRVAKGNAVANGLGPAVDCRFGNGWRAPAIRERRSGSGNFDLVFANILARPLCRMAGDLARHLAPGGTAILAGLLERQVRLVLAAHRRHGLTLERTLLEGHWATLVLRRRNPGTAGER